MSDELRPETRGAIQDATAAGVEVVMVTGDHVVTAGAIAADLGISRERVRQLEKAALEKLRRWLSPARHAI